MIEVLSPGTGARDHGIKRNLYAQAGVQEYWLVDPSRSMVIQCTRDASGALITAGELHLSADASLTSHLLPGFALSLASLFR